ncbi:TPA: hypothetical protein HA318_02310, partial [Candidatus Micrarchaeota archaeon]|nr:hypothetical protein [Candidatus Micrarchaeota archaeon]
MGNNWFEKSRGNHGSIFAAVLLVLLFGIYLSSLPVSQQSSFTLLSEEQSDDAAAAPVVAEIIPEPAPVVSEPEPVPEAPAEPLPEIPPAATPVPPATTPAPEPPIEESSELAVTPTTAPTATPVPPATITPAPEPPVEPSESEPVATPTTAPTATPVPPVTTPVPEPTATPAPSPEVCPTPYCVANAMPSNGSGNFTTQFCASFYNSNVSSAILKCGEGAAENSVEANEAGAFCIPCFFEGVVDQVTELLYAESSGASCNAAIQLEPMTVNETEEDSAISESTGATPAPVPSGSVTPAPEPCATPVVCPTPTSSPEACPTPFCVANALPSNGSGNFTTQFCASFYNSNVSSATLACRAGATGTVVEANEEGQFCVPCFFEGVMDWVTELLYAESTETSCNATVQLEPIEVVNETEAMNETASVPTISNIVVSAAAYSANISWTTDLDSSTRLTYGTDQNALDREYSDFTLVVSHFVALENLTNSTSYYYIVSSCVADNCSSQVGSFETLNETANVSMEEAILRHLNKIPAGKSVRFKAAKIKRGSSEQAVQNALQKVAERKAAKGKPFKAAAPVAPEAEEQPSEDAEVMEAVLESNAIDVSAEFEGGSIELTGVNASQITEVQALSSPEGGPLSAMFYLNGETEIESATITFEKPDGVAYDVVFQCSDEDWTGAGCANWVRTDIPLQQDGSRAWFIVDHFTAYAVGADANLTSWDETDSGMPYGDKTKAVGDQVMFFANYSYSNNSPITGANCTIWFNDTLYSNMAYNSSGFYNYSRSFASNGVFTWNVSCFQGSYAHLNTSDTVLIENATGIYNCSDLNAMRNDLNGSYMLRDNVDCDVAPFNVGSGFEPIGNAEVQFNGTFDGNGFNITGLFISRGGTYSIGLFGQTSSYSVIKNVRLVGAAVTGLYYVGALVGRVFGVVNNSFVAGTVSGSGHVGGLAGDNFGSIYNSNSSANVAYSIGGNAYSGGLFGDGDGSVVDSHATGSVSGNGQYVGGLAGRAYGNISRSYATGSVSGNDQVGGLIGFLAETAVSRSYSSGNVSGATRIGGFIGYTNAGSISNSYANGSVSASGVSSGGFIGQDNSGVVSNCYSKGLVTSSGGNVGGFIGWNNGNTISNSFFDANTSGQSNACGVSDCNSFAVPTSTADMKTAVVFADAGWTDAWFVNNTVDYPRLSWQSGVSIPSFASSSYAGTIISTGVGAQSGGAAFKLYGKRSTLTNSSLANVTFLSNFNLTSNKSLDGNVNLSNNYAFINSTALPELNASANISFTGLAFTPMRILFRDSASGSFEYCSAPRCNILSSGAGFVVFNVSQFSEYTASDSTNISACQDLTVEGMTYSLNQSVSSA